LLGDQTTIACLTHRFLLKYRGQLSEISWELLLKVSNGTTSATIKLAF